MYEIWSFRSGVDYSNLLGYDAAPILK